MTLDELLAEAERLECVANKEYDSTDLNNFRITHFPRLIEVVKRYQAALEVISIPGDGSAEIARKALEETK